jgi:peptidoglycan/LPS O-acetylase OafA/YrhL
MLSHLALRGFKAGGVSGVTLFFVLSGFLITSLLVEEMRETARLDASAFYRRRALRLLPALALLIVVVVVHHVAATHFSWIPNDAAPGRLWTMVLATTFYCANWFRAFGHTLGHLSHTWSLAIEEQFYLAWPALLLVLRPPTRTARRWRIAMVLTTAAVGTAVGLRFAEWHGDASINRVYFGTDTRADAPLIGCLLALWLTAGRQVRVVRLLWLPLGLLALAVSTWDYSNGFAYTWGPTLAALGGVAIIAWNVTRGAASRILTFTPLRHLGRISYGLYLWHIPIFNEVEPYVAGQNVLVRAAACVIPSYLAALISFRFVETPFLKMKRSLKRDPLAEGAARVTGDAPLPAET